MGGMEAKVVADATLVAVGGEVNTGKLQAYNACELEAKKKYIILLSVFMLKS